MKPKTIRGEIMYEKTRRLMLNYLKQTINNMVKPKTVRVNDRQYKIVLED